MLDATEKEIVLRIGSKEIGPGIVDSIDKRRIERMLAKYPESGFTQRGNERLVGTLGGEIDGDEKRLAHGSSLRTPGRNRRAKRS